MRRYLDLVVQVQPAALTDLVGRWLQKFCAPSTACRANAAILYREFSMWSGRTNCDRAFLEQLEAHGYRLDENGMVIGLALTDDFLAAANHEHLKSTN